jgi:diguanylate cyclase (GGDEF)-like protein/PAS domain S-box-containing protein
MSDQKPVSGANERDLQAEIARLNKIIQTLMNRAERSASIQGSDFNLFQTAVTLEDQVRQRTVELEEARLETEKITRTLRERENNYRLLLENSPVSIHEIDMDGRIISMSRAGVLMHGLKEESDVKGSLYLDGVSADDRERIGGLLTRACAGEISHFEFRASGPREAIFKSCFVPIKNKNGSVEKLMGITEDITERKCMDDKLRFEEQRFRAFVEHASDMIVLVNPEGVILYVNPAIESILGFKPEERIGANGSEIVHPDDVKALADVFNTLSRDTSSPVINGELRLRHKDGSWRTLEAVGSNLVNNNVVEAIIINYRDITERKKAQEQIQYMATHDLLTDLPSLRFAKDRLFVALSMARRYKKAVAVMFIDLDGFKDVNDTLGHDAGDYVLKQVARRLLSCVRETDTVSRVGGDEFLIIATEINVPENVAQIAEKVIHLVSQPIIFSGRQAAISASIGIALFPDDHTDMDQLIKKADEAMYRVKKTGKNGFCFIRDTIN